MRLSVLKNASDKLVANTQRYRQEGCQASDHSLSRHFNNCKLEIKETSGQFPAILQPKLVFLIRCWEAVFVATQQYFNPKQDLFPTLRFLAQILPDYKHRVVKNN